SYERNSRKSISTTWLLAQALFDNPSVRAGNFYLLRRSGEYLNSHYPDGEGSQLGCPNPGTGAFVVFLRLPAYADCRRMAGRPLRRENCSGYRCCLVVIVYLANSICSCGWSWPAAGGAGSH